MTIAVANPTPVEPVSPPPEAVVVRFAGDSGDGMQLTGGQFTLSTALAGNDLATFPDFPAEIRAPQGTTFGVSAFQINFGSTAIDTAGDAPDVLVAMNPAALKINCRRCAPVDWSSSTPASSTNATSRRRATTSIRSKTAASPMDQLVAFDISALTLEAVKPFGLGNKEALRCKNMWTLGPGAVDVRPRSRAADRLAQGQVRPRAPEFADANIAALNAGHAYGETAEIGGRSSSCASRRPRCRPGLYRTVTGAETVALGLVAGAQLAGPAACSSAAIRSRPASAILHHLAQAEGIRRHHLPGGGRDRGDLLGDRRVLCRAARCHLVVGSGHRAQGRGDWAWRS